MTGKKIAAKKRARKDDSPTEEEEVTWECTLCTYRNRYEAFKCEMCDTRKMFRKGTSTRKPRLHDNIVEMQKTVHDMVVKQVEKEKVSIRRRERSMMITTPTGHLNGVDSPSTSRHSPGAESSSGASVARSSNTAASSKKTSRSINIPDFLIFRTSPKKITVVVNGVEATITEFRRKPASNDRVPMNAQEPTAEK